MNIIDKLYIQAAPSLSDPSLVSDSTTSVDSIEDLFGKAVDIIALVAGIIAFFYLVYSGILYLTAAGNPDAAKKGQQGLINAIIGIIIIVAAWAILQAVAGGAETKITN